MPGPRYRRLALAVAVLAFVVIVLGAWVRLTGAGLGCPDWPGCYGRMVIGPDGSRLGAGLEVECADRLEGTLFGEGPARALLSVRPGDAETLARLAAREGVPLAAVGSVGGDALRIRVNGSSTVSLDLEGLADTFRNSLGRLALE